MAVSSLLQRACSRGITRSLRILERRTASLLCCSGGCRPEARSLSAVLAPCATYASVKVKKQRRGADSITEIINSEIKCAMASEFHGYVVDLPKEFPFKLRDNVGESTVFLERSYQGEEIVAEILLPHSASDGAAKDSSHEDKGCSIEPSIPVVVTVSKRSGSCLRFNLTVSPDTFSIHALTVKEPESLGCQYPCRGRKFLALDAYLQKVLLEYLESRGFTPNIANILLEYMICKDTEEYLRWLKMLKKFVQC